MKTPIFVTRLGLQGFERVQTLQGRLCEQLRRGQRHSMLVVVEHDAVYTCGQRRGGQRALSDQVRELVERQGVKADVVAAARGGDVTFHGPGQLVAYPLLDLKEMKRPDLRRYVRDLEETLILTCKDLGVENPTRHPVHTGVWVDNRKIAFIGVHASSWITSHGVSLNRTAHTVPFFRAIVPCGIQDCIVTSVEHEIALQEAVAMNDSRLVSQACLVDRTSSAGGSRSLLEKDSSVDGKGPSFEKSSSLLASLFSQPVMPGSLLDSTPPLIHPTHPRYPMQEIVHNAFLRAFQEVFEVDLVDVETPIEVELEGVSNAHEIDPTWRKFPIKRDEL